MVSREGVDTLLGCPGGAVLHIYDELHKMRGQLHHVLCRHEQGAIHMARDTPKQPCPKVAEYDNLGL